MHQVEDIWECRRWTLAWLGLRWTSVQARAWQTGLQFPSGRNGPGQAPALRGAAPSGPVSALAATHPPASCLPVLPCATQLGAQGLAINPNRRPAQAAALPAPEHKERPFPGPCSRRCSPVSTVSSGECGWLTRGPVSGSRLAHLLSGEGAIGGLGGEGFLRSPTGLTFPHPKRASWS